MFVLWRQIKKKLMKKTFIGYRTNIVLIYHYCENMLVHGLMIQFLWSIKRSSSRVQTEFFKTDGICAALHSINEFILLISVRGTDLQNFCLWYSVLRYNNFIFWCRKLRPVVICVYNFDVHLKWYNREGKTLIIFGKQRWKLDHNANTIPVEAFFLLLFSSLFREGETGIGKR